MLFFWAEFTISGRNLIAPIDRIMVTSYATQLGYRGYRVRGWRRGRNRVFTVKVFVHLYWNLYTYKRVLIYWRPLILKTFLQQPRSDAWIILQFFMTHCAHLLTVYYCRSTFWHCSAFGCWWCHFNILYVTCTIFIYH